MRASKLRPLAILLLIAPILPIAAQTSTPQSSATDNEYGIDPAKSYSGTTVLELLHAADEAAAAAIEDAYAEGYKAGLLDAAPDRDYWKNLAESWRATAEAASDVARWSLPWWVTPLAGLSGFAFGVIVR